MACLLTFLTPLHTILYSILQFGRGGPNTQKSVTLHDGYVVRTHSLRILVSHGLAVSAVRHGQEYSTGIYSTGTRLVLYYCSTLLVLY